MSMLQKFISSISKTERLYVYEGLPHQRWERELFLTEITRSDFIKIIDFPFYTPPKECLDVTLKNILSQPESYDKWRGEKMCGGFHPDYCIFWEDSEGYYVILVCFGCHEFILSYNCKNELFCDFSKFGENAIKYDFGKFEGLKKLLSNFDEKRPVKEKEESKSYLDAYYEKYNIPRKKY